MTTDPPTSRTEINRTTTDRIARLPPKDLLTSLTQALTRGQSVRASIHGEQRIATIGPMPADAVASHSSTGSDTATSSSQRYAVVISDDRPGHMQVFGSALSAAISFLGTVGELGVRQALLQSR